MFGYQKAVRRSLIGNGGVQSKILTYGSQSSQSALYGPISSCLGSMVKRWMLVGAIVLCTILPIHASFFGTQWIESHEDGLKVSGDGIPLSKLLKEWCDVCHKQCVIDADMKQKISISLEKSNCNEVYNFLSHTISVEHINQVYWFQKEPKGLWVNYTCQNRQPTEIATALKTLLSPMGKYEHVMADDATSLLWLPKRFYDGHYALIEKMDMPISQYRLYLSWLKVSDALINRDQLNDEDLWGWLNGQNKIIGFPQLMQWLQRYQQKGDMEVLSKMDMAIRSGEHVKAKLTELLPVERRDKKGNLYWKEVLQGVEIEIKTAELANGEVLLNLNLQDQNEIPNASQADIQFKNTLSLVKAESQILSSFYKSKMYKRRECKSTLSQVPFLGRLFCHYRKEYEKSKYILVVTLV